MASEAPAEGSLHPDAASAVPTPEHTQAAATGAVSHPDSANTTSASVPSNSSQDGLKTTANGSAVLAASPKASDKKKEVTKTVDPKIGVRLNRSGYSNENLEGDDWMKTPYVQPNVLAARDFWRMQLVEGGTAPVWGTTLSHLSQLGVGVALHFTFLKYLSCFFFIATAASIPIFALAFAGRRLTSDELDPLAEARLSVANLGDRVSLVNSTTTLFGGPKYTARQVSMIYTWTDLAIVLAFLLLIAILHFKMKWTTESADAENVTASDYSIMVKGLPSDATEAEVRQVSDNIDDEDDAR
jgi:hypothetical protein